jgi:hypothetical protein
MSSASESEVELTDKRPSPMDRAREANLSNDVTAPSQGNRVLPGRAQPANSARPMSAEQLESSPTMPKVNTSPHARLANATSEVQDALTMRRAASQNAGQPVDEVTAVRGLSEIDTTGRIPVARVEGSIVRPKKKSILPRLLLALVVLIGLTLLVKYFTPSATP